MIYIDGTTRDGTDVYVGIEDRRRLVVRIDGKEQPVQSAQVFRDGGTLQWITERGTITLPRRIEDRYKPPGERPLPTIGTQPIYPRTAGRLRRILGFG